MNTPDQDAAEIVGLGIDDSIDALLRERARLVLATARIAEIDAILPVLQNEKTRIDPRRPPRAPIDVPARTPETPRNVNPTR